jgi:Coenzyme PQQ synthesis protein D (PqqD)
MSYLQNPEIILREEEEGKYLVFNPDNGLPLIMNETSHFIWSQCDGKNDFEAIKSRLSQQYKLTQTDVTTEELGNIVQGHLLLLEKARLLLPTEAELTPVVQV